MGEKARPSIKQTLFSQGRECQDGQRNLEVSDIIYFRVNVLVNIEICMQETRDTGGTSVKTNEDKRVS